MINIVDKTKCCGCAACSNACPKSCIKMKMDKEGFEYPEIDVEECIKCNACDKACPILHYKEREFNDEQIAALIQHGDKEICLQSTAGGAFTAIAEYIINRGGSVFGVEITDNYLVHHIEVTSLKELKKFRNSKYVQSEVGMVYRTVIKQLDSGKLVCFSGTPCQVEGLRHYLKKDYDNLILVDLVCRAVPSPGIWKKYMKMVEQRNGNIKSIRFRDKSHGYQYSTMEMRTESGMVLRGGIESDLWLRMFFSGMIIRPSCTQCRFRSQYRYSDLTIWDCYNAYKIDKSFNENIGTTRMLIHTSKGKEIFEEIKGNHKYKELPVEIAVAGVKEMNSSPNQHPNRGAFFADSQWMNMDDLLKKYFPETLKVKIKKNARLLLNHLGIDRTVKHILKKG